MRPGRPQRLAIMMMTLALALASCEDPSDDPPAPVAEATKYVDAIVSRIKGNDPDAEEYAEARKIHVLDVDGDGVKDVVAFFTVEGFDGGNNYHFYLSVLRGRPGSLAEAGTLKIGGKGWRHIDFDRLGLEGGRLIVQTSEYEQGDPLCCPSRTGRARFKIDDHGLKEVTNTP
ncbi:hypothetical protein [Methylococcus sp. EFPC2]|uniref:hypothetical protein n=1 Tax=Methylococcus sp. EFPC2 TaxID=2812648 RepID=UPI0019683AFE|nr:hypothetical protein [Methylococcus sp. EFPC2]QSA96295.1 hypothetical protein JWZ97_13835 [Methylococcus sp. EFPC2]